MSGVRQFSFSVDGKKITVKSRRSTHCGNFAGYIVHINGVKYKIACLDRRAAEDKAYVQWVQDHT